MRRCRAIGDSRGSSEPLSSASIFSYTPVVTARLFDVADLGDVERASGRAAGLAGTAFPGEGGPADTALCAAKAPRSAGDPFDLAAVLCGHDPLTEVGRADARRDFRVWDLLEAMEGDR